MSHLTMKVDSHLSISHFVNSQITNDQKIGEMEANRA